MPLVKIYPNIAWNGAAGPQSLPAATSHLTGGVPCRGARQVVFVWKSTDSSPAQSCAINVGMNSARATGWLASSGIGYTLRGTPSGLRSDQGGIAVALERTAGVIYHDFAQFQMLTHATNPHPGSTLDAYVYYDTDADESMLTNGQAGVAVGT